MKINTRENTLLKTLVILFSKDYICSNVIPKEKRPTPKECPYCGKKDQIMRWYGYCKFLSFFETNILCDRLECNSCYGTWDHTYTIEKPPG